MRDRWTGLPQELTSLWDDPFTKKRTGGLVSGRGYYYQFLYSLAMAEDILKSEIPGRMSYEAYACEWMEDFFAWGPARNGNIAHALLVQVKTSIKKCFLRYPGALTKVFLSLKEAVEKVKDHLNEQTLVKCRLVFNPIHNCEEEGCFKYARKVRGYQELLNTIASASFKGDPDSLIELEPFLALPITRADFLSRFKFLGERDRRILHFLSGVEELTDFVRGVYGLASPLYVPQMSVEGTNSSSREELPLGGLHRDRIHANKDIKSALSLAAGRARDEKTLIRLEREHAQSQASARSQLETLDAQRRRRLHTRSITLDLPAYEDAVRALSAVELLQSYEGGFLTGQGEYAISRHNGRFVLEQEVKGTISVQTLLRSKMVTHCTKVHLVLSFVRAVNRWASRGVIITDFRADDLTYKSLYRAQISKHGCHFVMGDVGVFALSSEPGTLLYGGWVSGSVMAKALRYLYYGTCDARSVRKTSHYKSGWASETVDDYARWLEAAVLVSTEDFLRITEALFFAETHGWPLIFSGVDPQFIRDNVDAVHQSAAEALSYAMPHSLSEDRGHWAHRLLYASWDYAQVGMYEEAANALTLYRYKKYFTRRRRSARERDWEGAVRLKASDNRSLIFFGVASEADVPAACESVFGIPHSQYREWIKAQKTLARNKQTRRTVPELLLLVRDLFDSRRDRQDDLRNQIFSYESPGGVRLGSKQGTTVKFHTVGDTRLARHLKDLGYHPKQYPSLSVTCRDDNGARLKGVLQRIHQKGAEEVGESVEIRISTTPEGVSAKGTFRVSDDGELRNLETEDVVLRDLELFYSHHAEDGGVPACRAWKWLEPIVGTDLPRKLRPASAQREGTRGEAINVSGGGDCEIVEALLKQVLRRGKGNHWQIITGAAGTGKTRVTAELTYRFLEETRDVVYPPRRVLILGASHYAVDNFIHAFRAVSGWEKYVPYRYVTERKLDEPIGHRVFDEPVYKWSRAYYNELGHSLPQPRIDSRSTSSIYDYRARIENEIALCHSAQKYPCDAGHRSTFIPSHERWRSVFAPANSWRTDSESDVRRRYLQTKLDVINLYAERKGREAVKLGKQDANELYKQFASEIVATTVDAFDRLPDMCFDLIIVEEASQLSLIQLLKALTKVAWGRVDGKSPAIVLSGDPRQLPPFADYKYRRSLIRSRVPLPRQRTSISPEAYDLYETPFEMMCRRHPKRVTTLTTQYRMTGQIARLVNKIFYGEQDWIVTRSDEGNRVRWIDTSARNPRALPELGGKSSYNPVEISVVCELLRQPILKHQAGTGDILIITPYQAQEAKLIEALKREVEENLVRIRTIDGCQGIEARMVIVSLVNLNFSKDHDFVVEPRRINVALSRARDYLVLVGSLKEAERAVSTLGGAREVSHMGRLINLFLEGGGLSGNVLRLNQPSNSGDAQT